MSLTHCHECGAALPEHESGTLVFCSRCGAAQLQLSDELRERAEEQVREDGAKPGVDEPTTPSPDLDWSAALALAALGALAVAVLCAILPPMIGLAWLLPTAVLAIYQARTPGSRLGAGVGARLGVLCGVLCCGAFAVVATIQAVLLRFVTHRMGPFDASYAALLGQARQRAIGQYGPDVAAGFATLDRPEFRVGMLLLFAAMMAVVLLVLSAVSGALAGWTRAQARARRIG